MSEVDRQICEIDSPLTRPLLTLLVAALLEGLSQLVIGKGRQAHLDGLILKSHATINKYFRDEISYGLDLLSEERRGHNSPNLPSHEVALAFKYLLNKNWQQIIDEVSFILEMPKNLEDYAKSICTEDVLLRDFHDKRYRAVLRYIRCLYTPILSRYESKLINISGLGIQVLELIDQKRLQINIEPALEHLKSIYAACVLQKYYSNDHKEPLPAFEPHRYIKGLLAEGAKRLYWRAEYSSTLGKLLFDLTNVDWKRACRYLFFQVKLSNFQKQIHLIQKDLGLKVDFDNPYEYPITSANVRNAMSIIYDVIDIGKSENIDAIRRLNNLLSSISDVLIKLPKTYSHEGDKIGKIIKRWVPEIQALLEKKRKGRK